MSVWFLKNQWQILIILSGPSTRHHFNILCDGIKVYIKHFWYTMAILRVITCAIVWDTIWTSYILMNIYIYLKKQVTNYGYSTLAISKYFLKMNHITLRKSLTEFLARCMDSRLLVVMLPARNARCTHLGLCLLIEGSTDILHHNHQGHCCGWTNLCGSYYDCRTQAIMELWRGRFITHKSWMVHGTPETTGQRAQVEREEGHMNLGLCLC